MYNSAHTHNFNCSFKLIYIIYSRFEAMDFDLMEKTDSSRHRDSDPVFTIGITSRLTNTSVHTLRLYEERGLIIPFKTETKRRLYSRSDIGRINCIRQHLDAEGLNIAGIKAVWSMVPCWLFRPCTEQDRHACDAYTHTTLPCWEVETKGPECADADCRTCDIYLLGARCSSMKSMYKKLISNQD